MVTPLDDITFAQLTVVLDQTVHMMEQGNCSFFLTAPGTRMTQRNPDLLYTFHRLKVGRSAPAYSCARVRGDKRVLCFHIQNVCILLRSPSTMLTFMWIWGERLVVF